MGGLYPTLTKEQTFHVSGWRQRHPNLLTLNQHFKEQGYNTIGLGKSTTELVELELISHSLESMDSGTHQRTLFKKGKPGHPPESNC